MNQGLECSRETRAKIPASHNHTGERCSAGAAGVCATGAAGFGEGNGIMSEVGVPLGTTEGGVALAAALFVFYPWPATSKQPEKSIAVLPFINDSNDSTNVYLINGLMNSQKQWCHMRFGH